MKNNLQKSIPLIISLLVIGSRESGLWCMYSISHCTFSHSLHEIFPNVITPLYLFALWNIVPLFLLIFASKSTFSAWLRLTTWIVPVSLILVFVAPVYGGWFPDPLTRNNIATWTGGLFALITLAIIVRGQFFNKR